MDEIYWERNNLEREWERIRFANKIIKYEGSSGDIHFQTNKAIEENSLVIMDENSSK